MVPQPGLPVRQVPGVEQELVLGLVDVGLVPLDAPHVGQEQHGHEQGVVPQLLVIEGVGGHVLEAPLLRSGKALHNPAGALPAGGQILLLVQVFSHVGHGEKGGDGVDVQRREANLQLLIEILDQHLQIFFLSGFCKQLPQSV